jgi:hypothetical protein
MQDKQKVTLYLPAELHRQLKIKAAVDSEPMSALAERAIVFYLTHSEVVDEYETAHGHIHRVYACPDCSHSYVIRDGELVPLAEKVAVLEDEEELSVSVSRADWQGEEELVPC